MTRLQLLLAQTTTTDDEPLDFVSDFFDSEAWLVIRNVTLFFLVVFWLASAYWVYKDARRRIDDPWLLAMAVALGVFPPFVGPLLYMLFRPPEYLEDVRERELEIKAMEDSIDVGERCPVCRAAIEPIFLACPVCATKLKDSCRRCKAPLEPLWQICPFCETPVESPRAVENLSG
ncbi:MAG: zinc ribbon domain-containing protein [Gaiellaceae bacterium]